MWKERLRVRRDVQERQADQVISVRQDVLLRQSFIQWRGTLHLRLLYIDWRQRQRQSRENGYSDEEEEEEERELAAFVHWRHRCLQMVWSVWKIKWHEATVEKLAAESHRVRTMKKALHQWKNNIKQQQKEQHWMTERKMERQHQAFSMWRVALEEERAERRAVDFIQSSVTKSSLSFCSPILLSCLRPSVPSASLSDYFHRWSAYISHRRDRSQLMFIANHFHHTRLISAAFSILHHTHSLSALTHSVSLSIQSRRIHSALSVWRERAQERRRSESVRRLSNDHYRVSVVMRVMRGWKDVGRRGRERRVRREEVQRGLDELVVRNAFERWKGVVERLKRRERTFLISHSFMVWKMQARRVRERRELLTEAESM
jgi:hypothetical protein